MTDSRSVFSTAQTNYQRLMIPTESVFSQTVLRRSRFLKTVEDLVSGQRDSVAGRSHCLFALN